MNCSIKITSVSGQNGEYSMVETICLGGSRCFARGPLAYTFVISILSVKTGHFSCGLNPVASEANRVTLY